MKICRCGTAFESKHFTKAYCSSKCQVHFSKIAAWNRIKSDYRYRCCRLCGSAKYRAKKLNVSFNLDTKYLIDMWEEQQGRCAVSGRIFDLSRPDMYASTRANSPSLDRINSKEGYLKGNVRFVCYQVNTALNEYGEEALISLCKDILAFNGAVF